MGRGDNGCVSGLQWVESNKILKLHYQDGAAFVLRLMLLRLEKGIFTALVIT